MGYCVEQRARVCTGAGLGLCSGIGAGRMGVAVPCRAGVMLLLLLLLCWRLLLLLLLLDKAPVANVAVRFDGSETAHCQGAK